MDGMERDRRKGGNARGTVGWTEGRLGNSKRQKGREKALRVKVGGHFKGKVRCLGKERKETDEIKKYDGMKNDKWGNEIGVLRMTGKLKGLSYP
jgi:uncharacterized protein YjdB